MIENLCLVAFAFQPEADMHKMCSGHVTKVCFTADDKHLLTSGGIDAGVMQWDLVDATTRRR